jgi:hypothetical protein
VIYRTGTTIAYNQISASQLLANSVTPTALSPSSVVNSKIAPNAVTGDKLSDGIISSNNIVVGGITGNLIATQAVSANQIGIGAITTNLIASQAITGNLIADTAIASNNIVVGAITGNLIGVKAVSGNQIGLGSITSNHFVGGGITSDVFSSNLSISTVRISETVNVVTTPVSGNYQIYVADTGVYYFTANAAGSVTFNLIGRQGASLNDLISIGQSASVAIMLKQGVTRYRANVQVDGVLQTSYWLSNTQPSQAGSQSQGLDIYNFTVIKTENNGFTLLASNSSYAQANGQGMGPGGTQ